MQSELNFGSEPKIVKENRFEFQQLICFLIIFLFRLLNYSTFALRFYELNP